LFATIIRIYHDARTSECQILKCVFVILITSISYQNERDIIVKTSTFHQIPGVISRTVKFSQVQNHTRMKIYVAFALPTL